MGPLLTHYSQRKEKVGAVERPAANLYNITGHDDHGEDSLAIALRLNGVRCAAAAFQSVRTGSRTLDLSVKSRLLWPLSYTDKNVGEGLPFTLKSRTG